MLPSVNAPTSDKEHPMTIITRTLCGLALSAFGALAAAGAYAETHRAPDQS
jgi:hypothetical protein